MSNYEVNFEIKMVTYNNAVVHVEAASEEEAQALAEELMWRGDWDGIYESDGTIDKVEFDSIHKEG